MGVQYASNAVEESKLFQSIYPKGYEPYKIKAFDIIVAFILLIIAFIAYAKSLGPSVIAGDCGELTTEIYNMGACHPPGYPLYGIIGKLYTFLPIGDIAYRVNLFAATAGAGAVFFFYLIVVKFLGLNRDTGKLSFKIQLPAVCASFLFTFGYSNWWCVVGGKFYSLNTLLVALMIFVMILWYEEIICFRNEERLHFAERMTILLAFCMGLSLTNHQLPLSFILAYVIFLLPVAIIMVISDRSKVFKEEAKKRSGILLVFLVMACISIYLFLTHGYFNRLLMPEDVPPILTFIFLVPSTMAVYAIAVKLLKLAPNWVDDLSRVLAIGMWMFIFAVTLYLYLMIRAKALAPLPDPKPLSWGDTQTLDILFNHMLRRQYGMGGGSEFNNLLGQIKAVGGFYADQFHWVNLVAAGIGLIYFFMKDKIWPIYTIIAVLIHDFMLIKFINFEIDPRTLSFQESFFNQGFIFTALYIAFAFQFFMDLTSRDFIKNVRLSLLKGSENK